MPLNKKRRPKSSKASSSQCSNERSTSTARSRGHTSQVPRNTHPALRLITHSNWSSFPSQTRSRTSRESSRCQKSSSTITKRCRPGSLLIHSFRTTSVASNHTQRKYIRRCRRTMEQKTSLSRSSSARTCLEIWKMTKIELITYNFQTR